jgi:hypothetical protein
MTELLENASARPSAEPDEWTLASRPTSLVDLLDRLLVTGVVLSGDVTIALADVDLVTIKLRALITTVRGKDSA